MTHPMWVTPDIIAKAAEELHDELAADPKNAPHLSRLALCVLAKDVPEVLERLAKKISEKLA